MGYDNNECLCCHNLILDEGQHLETCLPCIDGICGSTTVRVTYALQNFDWNPNGRCTECNRSGITISVPLCQHHVDERKFINSVSSESSDSSDSSDSSNCYLCDYQG